MIGMYICSLKDFIILLTKEVREVGVWPGGWGFTVSSPPWGCQAGQGP